MLETPHVAVGAAIAVHVPNPFLSIPLAFASHFVLDMVPHWNPHINREIRKFGKPTKKSVTIIRVDSVLALVLGTAIAYHATPNYMQAANIMLCSFMSVIPDVVEIPYYFWRRKDLIIENWITWQKSIQNDAEPWFGISTQIIIVLASLIWIFQRN